MGMGQRSGPLGDEKQHVTKDEPRLPDEEKISYGKRFAQTEEMYSVRQMNRELEELARQDEQMGEQPGGAVKVSPELPPAPQPPVRGEPIGSLPTAAVATPPKEHLREVIEDGWRYAGMLLAGVRDVATAALKLARLPLDVATVAAQKLRPLRT